MKRALLLLLLAQLIQAQSATTDLGLADPSLLIENITLHLQTSRAQQAALQHFLAAQQNPASTDFHNWLTPEQFGGRFGLDASTVSQVTAWLRANGFRIDSTARGRTWVVFSGTASQLQSAFGLQMHRYRLRGEIHFANANSPVIPPALAGIISGFHGLNDFPHRPPPAPQYTDPTGTHYLAPGDIATIYNTAPLVKSGINGTGIKIAIPGQSAIAVADIDAFRTRYGLPAGEPQIVLGGSNPGTVSGAMVEADLDLEWAGAVAPNASLIYVYAKDVYSAEQYIIDNNLAPILSSSYGGCEQQGTAFDNLIAQQANAQGITWLSSSGDTGADVCDSGSVATMGLSVNEPASFPEVTGVGGTTFNEGSGIYWSATNSATLGSALSYIPEVAWNDSAFTGTLSASGGGASGFYPKPLWQNAPGVPADGARDVPDVAFAASPNHDGYEVSTGGRFQTYGGTSVSTPIFAGMVALLNQSLVSSGILAQPGLANINPTLYRLARTTSNVFHDVTLGNNIVPCKAMSLNCNNGTLGFFAGPGYDQVTGLGSLNAANLIAQWTIPAAVPSNVVAGAAPSPSYTKTVTVTLSEIAGGATLLTGFTISGQDYSSQIANYFGTATIEPYDSVSSPLAFSNLKAPASAIFGFSGRDPSGRTWSQQLTVQFLAALPAAATTVSGVSNGASFKTVFAPGMIMSAFGTNFAAATQAASSLPLPVTLQGVSAAVNGVAAPLYFVSAGQINLQIPYATAPGPATLTVTGSGGSATFPFTVQANAPGIFAASGALVPFASGKRGDTLLAFITGDGAVSSVPPYLIPVAPVGVTVGGVTASIAFAGIPPALVGVTQINFVVPAAAPLGSQPVIVTVGGISSPPVILTITQ